LITCSNNNQVLFWNYEYGKIVGQLNLDPNIEPTSLAFINGYSILILSESSGFVKFIHVNLKNEQLELK
jgi:hypothetical protein